MFEELKRVAVYAHRGASAFAPENTMAAFNKAVEYSADAVELDVTFSRDGQLIVFHDDTLDRVSSGTGKVTEIDYSDLRNIDVGAHFSSEYEGERIPLLEEVLIAVCDDLIVNIELKNHKWFDDALGVAVANLVMKLKVQERVVISSFYPWNLNAFAKELPNVELAMLTLPGFGGAYYRSGFFQKKAINLIHPYLKDVNEKFVNKQHNLGRKVNVWTVNEAADMQRMIEIGVDGLITDDPIMALSISGEKQ